ncbi:MAG: hypothetical protein PHP62_01810 [Candidatus Moranbacteria bacterium]|nr:hypothetical protein [Candidatus Moranbacteria bacterium]
MSKRFFGVIILITTAVIAGIIFWGIKQPEKLDLNVPSSQSNDEQVDIVYYFGQECSHCKKIEQFIKDNQIDQRVIFAKKEVWHNSVNNDELQVRVRECSLDPEKVGVPFLFARGKCYIGEIDVENFFKKEAGIE